VFHEDRPPSTCPPHSFLLWLPPASTLLVLDELFLKKHIILYALHLEQLEATMSDCEYNRQLRGSIGSTSFLLAYSCGKRGLPFLLRLARLFVSLVFIIRIWSFSRHVQCSTSRFNRSFRTPKLFLLTLDFFQAPR
jgi:hypothetical protein